MRVVKILFALLTVSLLVAGFAPVARANTVLDKTTMVTFKQPVEIPGQVLPAGKYLFEIYDTFTYRHIVRIYSPDRGKLFATILAIPNYRLTPTDSTVMAFAERPANAPQALEAWFYPGNKYGEEFVYPRTRAVELAQVTQENIPTVAKEPATVEQLKTEPMVAVTPENKEVTIAEAFPTEAPAAQPAEALPEPATLPKTASPVPFFGLSGVILIGAAFALKRLIS